MNLQEFADSVKEPTFALMATNFKLAWNRLHESVTSDDQTDLVLSSYLANLLTGADEFRELLRSFDLNPDDSSTRDIMLAASSEPGQYVLIVADDNYKMTSPATQFLKANVRSLANRVKRMAEDRSARDEVNVSTLVTEQDLRPLRSTPITLVRRPRLVRTCSPNPAWQVQVASQFATVGCRVMDGNGRVGVTTVRHAFDIGGAVATKVIGINVTVDGIAGTVVADDIVSDSVFIQLANGFPGNSFWGTNGWYQKFSPGLNAEVQFVGAISLHAKTAILAQDLSIPRWTKHCQAKVYTPPVTNYGDSGAALIHGEIGKDDKLVGFAFERTGVGELIEWSSWIWADSVLRTLRINPF
jgi:hypothetical protein